MTRAVKAEETHSYSLTRFRQVLLLFLFLFFQMEAKNLAIVFGPSLIRKGDDNMLAMVTDMSDHCKIIESIILHVSVANPFITSAYKKTWRYCHNHVTV